LPVPPAPSPASGPRRWDAGFFRSVDLGTLADEQFRRIGAEIVPGGTRLAAGLTAEAAADIGLKAGTPVAAGLIDAHAGGIGSVGARGTAGTVLSRMAYVFGTSACTMSTTTDPAFVPGVWGPYFSAMVPGLWLNEGGQSAAGAAIDHLVQMHPYSAHATRAARQKDQTLAAWLASQAEMRGGAEMIPELVGEIHVVPEFLGNRAPFADPEARALIAGLDMHTGIESLVALYLAGLCAPLPTAAGSFRWLTWARRRLRNFTVLPEIAVAKIREDAPFDKVCYIGCRVTTGIGAVINTAKVEPGAKAIVFGLGGIGLNVLQGMRLAGADMIIGVDINPERKATRRTKERSWSPIW
jgi:hypothetical protein